MPIEKIAITPEDIRNAVIDGMLCRAKETGELDGKREGMLQGKREGKREIVLALLESMDIEEVSRVTKLSVEKIEELRDFE